MSDHDGAMDDGGRQTAGPAAMTIAEVLTLSETMMPLVETSTPAEVRTTLAALPRPPGPAVATVEELDAGGVPLRLYVPHTACRGPLVVYLHGGGFVIGGLDTSDASVRRLAVSLGMAVVSVDYRLAPEHPFPAAVDDALTATRWCARLAADDDRFDGQLVLAGDSAGANLATVAALAASELGGDGIDVVHQLLVYPCVDPSRSHDSHRTQRSGNFLTSESMAWYWGHYLGEAGVDGDRTALTDWRVDPRRSDRLAAAPPTTVLLAGADPLHDEGAEYAQLLADAGVPVTVVDVPELFHGFAGFAALLPDAARALDEAAAHIVHDIGAKIDG